MQSVKVWSSYPVKTYLPTAASHSYPQDQDLSLKIFDVSLTISWTHQSKEFSKFPGCQCNRDLILVQHRLKGYLDTAWNDSNILTVFSKTYVLFLKICLAYC